MLPWGWRLDLKRKWRGKRLKPLIQVQFPAGDKINGQPLGVCGLELLKQTHPGTQESQNLPYLPGGAYLRSATWPLLVS